MLFNDHGILHRDISLNNILLYRAKEDETADGLLIDFDYSEELDILDSESDTLDAHDGEHAIEECEDRVDEAADVEECEASTDNTDKAAFAIDSIRTVRLHFIICTGRCLTSNVFRGPHHLWQSKHLFQNKIKISTIVHTTILSRF
jgi:hypothetical protein